MLRLTLQDAQQEAADLQQGLMYANPAYEEVAQYSVDAERATFDIQQQLSKINAAHEEDKQDAENQVAFLELQLEQAGVAHDLAVSSLRHEMQQTQLQFTALIQVCLC